MFADTCDIIKVKGHTPYCWVREEGVPEEREYLHGRLFSQVENNNYYWRFVDSSLMSMSKHWVYTPVTSHKTEQPIPEHVQALLKLRGVIEPKIYTDPQDRRTE
ncbi:MAG: hypothetical protein MPJ22_08500 [Pirellulales bacterium]|nr:hypothetical protein [Pirellulales bacterium]